MTNWTPEQIAAWRAGNWTKERVHALELVYEEHVNDCDECFGECNAADPDECLHCRSGEDPMCPVGRSLMDTWSDAGLEFSWQPNFLL